MNIGDREDILVDMEFEKQTNQKVADYLLSLRPHAGHGCLKRLFINFFDQMSYFTTQEVGNPMQIIKYVELPRFQPILKH